MPTTKRAIVFSKQVERPRGAAAGPLVAYDPLTGQSEVILEHFVPADDPDDAGADADDARPVELSLPEDFPDPPALLEAPFRAIVVPRRLGTAGALPPLMPGARQKMRLAALRPPRVPSLGAPSPRAEEIDIALTEFPVQVTTTGAQALELARDVLDADELVLELQVLSLFGAMGPADITVELQTGMQLEATTGWVPAGSFTIVTTAPSAELKRFTGLLRYVRWNVSALGGSGPTATFFVSGVRRRWSKGGGDGGEA